MSRSRSAVAPSSGRAVLVAWIVAFSTAAAQAQDGTRSPGPADQPTPIASTRSVESIADRSAKAPSAGAVRAVPKAEGTASPGLQVTLDGTASTGGRVWYRWLQTVGPVAAIDDPTASEARFVVPPDAQTLGFVLVVGNASGVDAKSLSIDIDDPERDGVDRSLKADAGDDQAAKVGRKVVLNGVRSEPRGQIRYRWVQAGGPRVVLKAGEGATATFVPASSGTYRFALVVSSPGGVMSEPATVEVAVGGTTRASADAPSMAIDELARVSLASIEGGSKYADDLSKSFDSAADSIGTFRTFADAIGETTRRLDAVVPRDRDRRAVWIERLFTPLMSRIVAGLKDDGLDLAQPGAQAKPLTRAQKIRLAEQFRYAAAGLRSAKAVR